MEINLEDEAQKNGKMGEIIGITKGMPIKLREEQLENIKYEEYNDKFNQANFECNNCKNILTLHEGMVIKKDKLEDFIASLLAQRQNEWVEEIKGIRQVKNPNKIIMENDLSHIDGYNKAIDRVIALLEANK